jgi:hypothetical protein
MTVPPEFASPGAYRQAFADGFVRMLGQHESLGTYILAMANATQDPTLWQMLERRLEERHYHLAALITTALRQGRRLSEPDDDLLVFLKLVAIGFGAAGLAERREIGPWEAQFNPLRALRPPRASGARAEGSAPPAFARAGFQFNQPFLRDEILWEGALRGREARLLYNKFPFAELHGLLVPDPDRELPQLLTPALHGWAWEVTLPLGASLPGFGLAYNSYGAGASVNHLHFQSFLRGHPLPVEDLRWAHNGGGEAYPAACQVFDDLFAAWAALDELHARGVPYNLVYRPGRLYLLPRRPQGGCRHAPWAAGHAWYEMAGGAVCFNREDFRALDASAIAAELRLTVPD